MNELPPMQLPPRRLTMLSGLSGQNVQAIYEGQEGFWVQGDCVFIPGAKSPQDGIAQYRERIEVGRIAVNHNFGTHGIRELQAKDLAIFRVRYCDSRTMHEVSKVIVAHGEEEIGALIDKECPPEHRVTPAIGIKLPEGDSLMIERCANTGTPYEIVL